ncbi:MAG: hypothetical protein JKX72_06545 [Robiginitomaculum sp.]|nr:hypothetical protein [Robiginitomaculum sp.]
MIKNAMFTFLVLHDRRPPKYETLPASRFHIWEVFCHKLTIYAKATRLEDGGFRPKKVDTKALADQYPDIKIIPNVLYACTLSGEILARRLPTTWPAALSHPHIDKAGKHNY